MQFKLSVTQNGVATREQIDDLNRNVNQVVEAAKAVGATKLYLHFNVNADTSNKRK